MSLKEKSLEFLMSIPHLALLWDMRKQQRFEPCQGLNIEIKSQDEKIYALLLNICMGGMRIVSTDHRIGDSKVITLAVDDFQVHLPCERIRKIEYQYGIKFGYMDEQASSHLAYFIKHFTKAPPNFGLVEILK